MNAVHTLKSSKLHISYVKVAAIDLTMSSMMTVPVAMSAVILPNLVRKKRWGQSGLYLLAVLPCVLVLGVYLLGVRGILQIPVVR